MRRVVLAVVALAVVALATPSFAQAPAPATPNPQAPATATTQAPAAATPAPSNAQVPGAENYAWVNACKDCHSQYFDAWEKTKHSTAIRRLSGGDREKDCVQCHVTGPKQLLDKDVNANIQCEECHGPGKAHIAAAAAGNAKPGNIVRKPSEKMCVDCHSSKSPHFKFFSYPALAPLIHQVPKK